MEPIRVLPIQADVRERLVARIAKENDFTVELANSVVNEALVYMAASAASDAPIGPSALVDIGWHAFILYTREYAEYCDNAYGKFLHHSPSDRKGEAGIPLKNTIDFFEANGIAYDPELWGLPSGPWLCSRCGGEEDTPKLTTAGKSHVAINSTYGECSPRCRAQCRPSCDPAPSGVPSACSAEDRSDCDNGSYGGGSACHGQCS